MISICIDLLTTQRTVGCLSFVWTTWTLILTYEFRNAIVLYPIHSNAMKISFTRIEFWTLKKMFEHVCHSIDYTISINEHFAIGPNVRKYNSSDWYPIANHHWCQFNVENGELVAAQKIKMQMKKLSVRRINPTNLEDAVNCRYIDVAPTISQ